MTKTAAAFTSASIYLRCSARMMAVVVLVAVVVGEVVAVLLSRFYFLGVDFFYSLSRTFARPLRIYL